MGLQGPPRIGADQLLRSHVTVIRRNWHILPYDQILELLGWTEDQLAYALREDDFLFIKLGSLKPRCERLVYAEPGPAEAARAREIADTVRGDFPDGVGLMREPLFQFVRALSAPAKRASDTAPTGLTPRFCYSYFGLYGDPLADPRSDPYPAGYLARLADSGVDGVWLQGVLTKLAPFPWQPELSTGHEARLAGLRRLVARAKRHGIRVFLYLNEPRTMPLSFFERRPELKGVAHGEDACLCTSVPEVREHLSAAVAHISKAVPDLGGYFTITASENPTNCWSHFRGGECTRCSKRSGAQVIAEVNSAVADGIRRGGATQRLIAWDWGWPDAWAEEAIAALPADAALMSVSEWSLPINRGGVATTVGEYSLSAVGPGPRATRHWSIARGRGLPTLAKVQAACSWELSAFPYIPAVRLSAEHASKLRGAQLTGLMLGWTLGGYPSPNLEAVREVAAGRSVDDALMAVATARFGKSVAPRVVEAWGTMSAAFGEFPFHVGVVYTAPLQVGPANLLWAQPTGYRATMVGIAYDDLDSWRAVYPPEVFVRQMRAVADGFAEGASALRGAEHAAPADRRQAVAAEARIAEGCAAHFRSVAAQAEYVHLRNSNPALVQVAPAKESPSPLAPLKRVRELLTEEIETARRLYSLQTVDSRIGFEATNQYYYVPCDLAEKVLNCRWLLKTLPDR
ncbi:MAG: hypothetical protein FJX72_11515 [Armatimonadetes bacterium]|nr:hypothetical protein [Armatimonadota bacterium]